MKEHSFLETLITDETTLAIKEHAGIDAEFDVPISRITSALRLLYANAFVGNLNSANGKRAVLDRHLKTLTVALRRLVPLLSDSEFESTCSALELSALDIHDRKSEPFDKPDRRHAPGFRHAASIIDELRTPLQQLNDLVRNLNTLVGRYDERPGELHDRILSGNARTRYVAEKLFVHLKKAKDEEPDVKLMRDIIDTYWLAFKEPFRVNSRMSTAQYQKARDEREIEGNACALVDIGTDREHHSTGQVSQPGAPIEPQRYSVGMCMTFAISIVQELKLENILIPLEAKELGYASEADMDGNLRDKRRGLGLAGREIDYVEYVNKIGDIWYNHINPNKPRKARSEKKSSGRPKDV